MTRYISMEPQSRASFSKNTAGVILLFHAALAGYFFYKGFLYDVFFMTGYLVLVSAIPYLNAFRRGNFILYDSLYIFLAAATYSYVIYFLFLFDTSSGDLSDIAYAIQYAIIGNISLMLGYFLGFGKSLAGILPLKKLLISDKRLSSLVPSLYVLWFMLKMLLYMKISIPFSMFQLIENVSQFAILTALMVDTRLSCTSTGGMGKIYLTRLCFFLPLQLIFIFLSGFGGQMITPLVLIALAYLKTKKKIPFLMIAIVLVIIVLFTTFMIPFTKAFREPYWKGESMKDSINYAFQSFERTSREERVQSTIQRGIVDMEIAVLCIQLRRDNIKIGEFHDIEYVVSRFIPRFLWPDKPVTMNGNMIGKALGLIAANDDRTSVGLTLLAEFILNGGIFGVIIGMFIVGSIARTYWHWLIIRAGDNFFTFGIYMMLVYRWTIGSEELFINVHSNITFFVYVYFFLFLVAKWKKA